MNILEGTGKLSREAYMHVLLLKNFKNIGATIHAHPMYCMVFVAQTKPIPNITEATMKRGPVECIPYTQAYTTVSYTHLDVYKRQEVIKQMVGRELNNIYPTVEKEIGEVAFVAKDICQEGRFENLGLEIREGEIL